MCASSASLAPPPPPPASSAARPGSASTPDRTARILGAGPSAIAVSESLGKSGRAACRGLRLALGDARHPRCARVATLGGLRRASSSHIARLEGGAKSKAGVCGFRGGGHHVCRPSRNMQNFQRQILTLNSQYRSGASRNHLCTNDCQTHLLVETRRCCSTSFRIPSLLYPPVRPNSTWEDRDMSLPLPPWVDEGVLTLAHAYMHFLRPFFRGPEPC